MDQQQQQQLPATPPVGAKQVRRSSLKMASSVLKKYHNQQLPKSALSPFSPIKARGNSSSMRMKRRSSLTNTGVVARRGHSDIALGSSTAASGIAHLRGKKRLGRSISWDVRPPRVHESKQLRQAKQQQQGEADAMMVDDDKNESWYSVCFRYELRRNIVLELRCLRFSLAPSTFHTRRRKNTPTSSRNK